jgi:hypothetical protein
LEHSQGRRKQQLPYDLNEKKGCWKLKEEALCGELALEEAMDCRKTDCKMKNVIATDREKRNLKRVFKQKKNQFNEYQY